MSKIFRTPWRPVSKPHHVAPDHRHQPGKPPVQGRSDPEWLGWDGWVNTEGVSIGTRDGVHRA